VIQHVQYNVSVQRLCLRGFFKNMLINVFLNFSLKSQNCAMQYLNKRKIKSGITTANAAIIKEKVLSPGDCT
jgi:hypothetical protein